MAKRNKKTTKKNNVDDLFDVDDIKQNEIKDTKTTVPIEEDKSEDIELEPKSTEKVNHQKKEIKNFDKNELIKNLSSAELRFYKKTGIIFNS